MESVEIYQESNINAAANFCQFLYDKYYQPRPKFAFYLKEVIAIEGMGGITPYSLFSDPIAAANLVNNTILDGNVVSKILRRSFRSPGSENVIVSLVKTTLATSKKIAATDQRIQFCRLEATIKARTEANGYRIVHKEILDEKTDFDNFHEKVCAAKTTLPVKDPHDYFIDLKPQSNYKIYKNRVVLNAHINGVNGMAFVAVKENGRLSMDVASPDGDIYLLFICEKSTGKSFYIAASSDFSRVADARRVHPYRADAYYILIKPKWTPVLSEIDVSILKESSKRFIDGSCKGFL